MYVKIDIFLFPLFATPVVVFSDINARVGKNSAYAFISLAGFYLTVPGQKPEN